MVYLVNHETRSSRMQDKTRLMQVSSCFVFGVCITIYIHIYPARARTEACEIPQYIRYIYKRKSAGAYVPTANALSMRSHSPLIERAEPQTARCSFTSRASGLCQRTNLQSLSTSSQSSPAAACCLTQRNVFAQQLHEVSPAAPLAQ